MSAEVWEPLRSGLRAHLWIECPGCGDNCDYLEFDSSELSGLTEVTADCPDCGHRITAYLDAMVQHVAAAKEPTS